MADIAPHMLCHVCHCRKIGWLQLILCKECAIPQPIRCDSTPADEVAQK